MSSFLKILKERFRHIFNLLQMDLARASLVLIWVLRTLINSIAKNLHKLKICLRFYSLPQKTRHSGYLCCIKKARCSTNAGLLGNWLPLSLSGILFQRCLFLFLLKKFFLIRTEFLS